MSHVDKQVSTPSGRKALGPAREVSMRLPEVVEALDAFRHISFRIRNRPFVMMGEDEKGPWLSVKADVHTQEWLLRRGGFSKTPYIGQHGWVTVDSLAAADWGELEELIIDAYERVAPKRLADKVRESRR